MDDSLATPTFDRRRHISFYLRHLSMLPQPYTAADSQRLTLAYFALSSLDLLGAVDQNLSPADRGEYADWIYDQQCSLDAGGGFRGSPAVAEAVPALARLDALPFLGGSSSPSQQITSKPMPAKLACGNLAMTYTALLSLSILRDDFARLDRPALHHHLSTCQQADGSFAPSIGHREYDCRFLFCAFAICWMLDDWTVIDLEMALGFLRRSRCWDGSFGQSETQEGHGGSTYCAVAALSLAGRLDVLDDEVKGRQTTQPSTRRDKAELERWLLNRQQPGTGFNGRLEKPVDTCYSFWCGATLEILGQHSHIDASSDISWILSAATPIAGISKVPGDPPDLMHSYLSTAALALHAHAVDPEQTEDEAGRPLKEMLRKCFSPLDPALNLSTDTKQWLVQHLHRH